MTNEDIKALAQSIHDATAPTNAALESALACLRHTHDRLIDYPEFETLRITINAEVRAARRALGLTSSDMGRDGERL